MRCFIVRQNIERFERLLSEGLDDHERSMFEQLLAQARNELYWLENIWSQTCPHLGISDSVGANAERCLDRVVMARGANFGSLQLLDIDTAHLCLIAHHNFDRSSVEQFARVRNGEATTCDAARILQASVFVEDIESADGFASLRDWTRRIGIRAIQTTPIFGHSGKFIGAFSTHYASPRSFSSEEREMNSVSSEQFRRLFADMGRT